MQQSTFGRLGESSAGTLGGSGTGQGWGPTTREEGAATVHEAVEAGITFFDVAPNDGNGEAQLVIGEAVGGRLPEGVQVSTTCRFSLHNQRVPDDMADRHSRETRTPAAPQTHMPNEEVIACLSMTWLFVVAPSWMGQVSLGTGLTWPSRTDGLP